MQTRRSLRTFGLLACLLMSSACDPGAFDEHEDEPLSPDAGSLDAAGLAPDAGDLDATALLDARPMQSLDVLDDGSVVDAASDALVTSADAGPACFASASSLITYLRMEGSPADAISPSSGGATVAAVGASFDVGHAGSALHAGELAVMQSRLDAPSALTISAWLRLDSAPDVLNAAWLWNGDTTGEDWTAGYWMVVAGPSFRPENAKYLTGKPAQGHLGLALTNGSEEQILLTDQPLPLLRYNHVVATFDGARARLFVDGVVVRDEVQMVAPRSTGQPLRLASPLGGSVGPLPGQLDEVAFFDRALSDAEVSALYQYSGLVCTN